MRRAVVAAGLALLPLLLLWIRAPRTDADRLLATGDGGALASLTREIAAGTGGDDLVAVVLVDESGDKAGLLDPAGLAAIEELRAAMEAIPVLHRVRSVTNAVLLAEVDGAITGVRPLSPPPATEAAWEDARRAVLGDPFARDTWIASDLRTALVAGWLFRGDPERMLVRRATAALAGESFRSSADGAAIQDAVNGARLAVALGQTAGPADAEAARRLAAIEDGPGASQVRAWLAAAADDPAAEAIRGLETALDEWRPPAGIRAGLAGPAVTRAALERAVPRGVALGLLGLVLLAATANLASGGTVADGALAGEATAAAFVASVALFGILGIPLHTLSAVAALTGSAWTGGLLAAAARGERLPRRTTLACAAAICLPGAAGLGLAGAALAAPIALAVGTVAAWLAAPRPPDPRTTTIPAATRWWATQVAAAILVAGLAVSLELPLGLDAARMLSQRHPAGRATLDLADGMGLAPSAFAAWRSPARPRAMGEPDSLRAFRTAQGSLEADEAIAGTRSFADFVSALHARVSGDPAGSLPSSAGQVAQYLVAFGQPEQTRSLATDDLGLGVAVVRVRPGQGARLGALAERWPAAEEPVGLAGEGVRVALAARQGARGMLAGGTAALLLAVLAIGTAGSRRSFGLRGQATAALGVAASSAAALSAASAPGGSIAPVACAAAATVLGIAALSALLERRAALAMLAVAGAGPLPMLASPVVELHGFALGLLAGCAAAACVRLGEAPAAPTAAGPAGDARTEAADG